MEPEPPGVAFFAWSRSRPNLVGAGVGSGTSDFRSRPKKWRLRNTVLKTPGSRAVDPHSFYADPDQDLAVFMNADPDPEFF